VRAELFAGDAARAAAFCGFDPAEKLPTYLVMGGSQGAQRINEAMLAILPWLVTRARVVHLTGKGKALDFAHPRYKGFEFVSAELKDLFALADFVVSRSGANSIFEFLALRKPMLLIPLELGSRGDQIVNAESFVKNGWAAVLRETALTSESLKAAMLDLEKNAEAMRAKQSEFAGRDAADKILAAIAAVAKA
jgi:UDP-N-acetylglucosamine--N-acetylmuramyl-(pentapeptide) pyrophosphoryl-undecaprenol N-acetylglucosamine transferase